MLTPKIRELITEISKEPTVSGEKMARKSASQNESARDGGMDDAKRAVLDKALGDIVKRYGDGSIMRLGEAHSMVVDAIPSGSLSLDIALGVGGLPRGRITEIYGPESSGKTTLCQHIVAEAQKLGGTAAFIDMEHALDPGYAAKVGVDIDNLLVSQPDTGEQALEITETLVRSGAVDVVVVDSVAALVPRSELEGDMGDATMGVQARLMSQALRKLSGAINQTKTMLIFTNQLRQKIGVMFGNPETTTGGQALKFYATVRLDVRRIQSIKLGAEVIGNRTRVRVVKNKVAPPFRTAEFDIMYNEGISKEGDLLDLATQFEIVQKRGAFFSYGDIRLGQGRENSKEFLRQNPEVALEVETIIRQKALGGELVLPMDMSDDDGGGSED
jgi:recombination protein RecA